MGGGGGGGGGAGGGVKPVLRGTNLHPNISLRHQFEQ